jgi:uncharacterized membrane protein YtjA (UPF0391 family)
LSDVQIGGTMLSWALAFFIVAIISAIFGFTGITCSAKQAAAPPWFRCPDYMVCTPPPAPPLAMPEGFICPDGWTCKIAATCAGLEIAKVLFVVFVVLFLVSLVAGLLRRP